MPEISRRGLLQAAGAFVASRFLPSFRRSEHQGLAGEPAGAATVLANPNARFGPEGILASYDQAIALAYENDPKQVRRFERLKTSYEASSDITPVQTLAAPEQTGPHPRKEGERQIRVDFGNPIETKPTHYWRGTTLDEFRVNRLRTNEQAGLTAVLHDNGVIRFIDRNGQIITRGEQDLSVYYGGRNNVYDFKITDGGKLLIADGHYDNFKGFKVDGVKLLTLNGAHGEETSVYHLENPFNDLRFGTAGDITVIAEISGGWEGEDDNAKYRGKTVVKSFRGDDLSTPIAQKVLETNSPYNHDGEVYTMDDGRLIYLHGDQAVVFAQDGAVGHHIPFPPENRLDGMWVYDPKSQQVVTMMPGIQWNEEERPASSAVTADAAGLAIGAPIGPKHIKVEEGGGRYYDGAMFPGYDYLSGAQWPVTNNGYLTAPVFQPGILEGNNKEWWKAQVLGVMDLTRSHVPESVTLVPANHDVDNVEPGAASLDSQVIPYHLGLPGGRVFFPALPNQ